MPPRELEESLIDRTLSGGNDAFGELVQPYMTFLNAFARKRLQSEFEAQDVVQQSVFQAFRHLPQYRRTARFKAWLSAIAMNEVLQSIQGRQSSRVRLLPESLAADFSDPWNSPHLRCEQKQRAERLGQALERLPEKYRLVIQLRDLNELSISETAHLLSLSSAAVRTRHHRARKLLTRSLSQKTPRRVHAN